MQDSRLQSPGRASAAASTLLIQCPVVVFVDDEQFVLESLKRLFRKEGHNFLYYQSPVAALEFLRQNKVDVLVSDLNMPHMNGSSFLKQAKEIRPDATRIILSSHLDKPIALDALTEGLAQHFLVKPWNDREFKAFVEHSIRLTGEMQSQRLRSFLNSLNNLPSPPKFQLRLHEILENPESSFNDLVREIELNPAFVAKVLQVANSIYFGARRRISSVRDAVIFVGMEYVGRLLISIEVFQNFLNEVDLSVRFRVDQLWEQALVRGPIARNIAMLWKEAGCDPQSAYVASVLQDVGLLVRVCSEPDRYEYLVDRWKTESISLYEADVQTFSIPHDQVGATLLELWNFPSEVVYAVAHHHTMTGEDPLTQILQLAEALASEDTDFPHDHVIDPLIEVWRQRLENTTQVAKAN